MDRIEVGYVARAHGIRGELRVVPFDPDSTLLSEVPRVHIDEQPYDVAAVRPVKGAFLVRLDGLADRNQAERLRGKTVSVERDLIPLDDDEVLLADLVGCDVVLADGTPYGTIAAIDIGVQDRLVIHDGDIERLLPVVSEFIQDVDVDERRVVVTPPEDLPESPR